MKHRQAPTKPTKSKASHTTTNQVRIIGGLHRRRLISFIDADGLRPTPDRLRETLFNWLTGYLTDASVLDVCAGSGVLGFEAISRGAMDATMIELNPAQAKQLQQSADTLGISDKVSIINADATLAMDTLSTAFDVVFLDPPYAANLWQTLLDKLIKGKHLHADTRLYLESDKPLDSVLDADTLGRFDILKNVKVGQAYAYLLMLKDG